MNVEVVAAAAGRDEEEITVNVHPDLVGSSCYLEEGGSNVNGIPQKVTCIRLDGLALDRRFLAPILLKVDAQGAERDVLRGAEQVLQSAELVVLEVSFFEFFKNGPQFYEVVEFMRHRGFVVYDIVGLQYRLLDDALSQADVAFCREHGLFRSSHAYATSIHREAQNRRFELDRAKLVRRLTE